MADRTHTSPPIKVIGPTGNLTFQQVRRTHLTAKVPGPDHNEGHVTHSGGAQAFLPSLGVDRMETTLNEAEATAGAEDFGNTGRLEKTAGTIVPRPAENEYLHDDMSIAARGKVFSGRIPFTLS